MGGSYFCLTPVCDILSLMADSGMDLENPRPDQKSVGVRDSPIGFFCMAVKQVKNKNYDTVKSCM